MFILILALIPLRRDEVFLLFQLLVHDQYSCLRSRDSSSCLLLLVREIRDDTHIHTRMH